MSENANLSLHASAAEHFNAAMLALILQIQPEQASDTTSVVPPDAYVERKITEEDIIADSIVKGTVDITGRDIAKFFHDQTDGWVGLDGDRYKSFVELTESMQRLPELSPFLSRDFIEKSLFDWFKSSYHQQADSTAVDHLLEAGTAAISSLEIWIPIPTLSTTVSFTIGKVTIQSLSRRLFDEWQHRSRSESAEGFNRFRSKFQGLAAATICVRAERTRASEIALEETERALAGLRLFSPEILHPYGRSYWEPQGFLDPSAFDVLFTEAGDPGNLLGRYSTMPRDRVGHPALTQEKVVELFRMGLGKVHNLLLNDHPSPFQKECLSALLQYSRSALKRDPSEKLLYIISALESIFASDAAEAGIGRTLQERLAIFIRSDLKERLELTKRIRLAYGLRSAFVHRSLPVDDLALIGTFMIDAMAAFRNLWLAASIYQDKAQFFRDLDGHRLLGPSFHPLDLG